MFMFVLTHRRNSNHGKHIKQKAVQRDTHFKQLLQHLWGGPWAY